MNVQTHVIVQMEVTVFFYFLFFFKVWRKLGWFPACLQSSQGKPADWLQSTWSQIQIICMWCESFGPPICSLIQFCLMKLEFYPLVLLWVLKSWYRLKYFPSSNTMSRISDSGSQQYGTGRSRTGQLGNGPGEPGEGSGLQDRGQAQRHRQSSAVNTGLSLSLNRGVELIFYRGTI